VAARSWFSLLANPSVAGPRGKKLLEVRVEKFLKSTIPVIKMRSQCHSNSAGRAIDRGTINRRTINIAMLIATPAFQRMRQLIITA
jgi:hypothetical protein